MNDIDKESLYYVLAIVILMFMFFGGNDLRDIFILLINKKFS